jgi:hypothetical protein
MDRLLAAIISNPRAAQRRGARVAFALIAILTSSCSQPLTLENTLESDHALARAVLDGFARSDRDTLLRLAVSKAEFEELVWPTLGVSRRDVGMPVDYVWQDTFTKSRAHLARTLHQFGGRRYELVRVEFRGTTSDHGTHSISRQTRLIVVDEAGRDLAIGLFGSIIRQNGRSKVFSYIVD